jgi:hypothetical protein
MTKKKLPKINRRRAAGSGSGYSHDNACVAFGNPMDAIEKREFLKKYERDYNEMYRKETKEKDRSKILRKNETMPCPRKRPKRRKSETNE